MISDLYNKIRARIKERIRRLRLDFALYLLHVEDEWLVGICESDWKRRHLRYMRRKRKGKP